MIIRLLFTVFFWRTVVPIVVLFLANNALVAQDIYDKDRVNIIKITFKTDRWEAILDSLKSVGNKDRLVGDVEVNGKLYPKCGVRYKGNSSYASVRRDGSSKLPLNIEADHVDKQQAFDGKYETLKLANVFRDPTYTREVLSYDIARDYMPVPRANFAKVYINGKYVGFYNNTESIDDAFLDTHFGYDKGTFVKCDPENWNFQVPTSCKKSDKAALMYLGDDPRCYRPYYELKTDEGWEDLMELTKVLNETPEKLEDYFDVDQALWMLAFNNLTVNLDSYNGRLCHNYYLYKNKAGQFVPLLWDLNLGFGGFRYGGLTKKSLTTEELQTMSAFEHYKQKNENRPLITNLLGVSLYRKLYIGKLRTMLYDHFDNKKYLSRINEIQSSVADEVRNDPENLYEFSEFHQNINETVVLGKSPIIGIQELMEARTTFLKEHPIMQGAVPTRLSHTAKRTEEQTLFTCVARDVDAVHLVYRDNKKHRFRTVKMSDSGNNGDVIAQDGTYSFVLKEKGKFDYYFILEGGRFATTHPKNASWQYLETE